MISNCVEALQKLLQKTAGFSVIVNTPIAEIMTPC